MDFPPNLHILHGRAGGGRAQAEELINFPILAVFPHLPRAASWAGTPLLPLSPLPPSLGLCPMAGWGIHL